MTKEQQNWTLVLTFCMATAIVISLSSCTGMAASEPRANQPTIDIGAIFILSGIGSDWGTDSMKGAELAIKDINQEGLLGKQVKIVYEDNKGSDPREAITALTRLVSQNITLILGPNWSPTGKAIAPVACDRKALMISPSLGIAEFNEVCEYAFNLWPHDALMSYQLGVNLVKQGFQRIAVIGSDQTWEQAQADALKAGIISQNITPASFIIIQNLPTDFATKALKVKSSKPDVVVFTNFETEASAARKLRELGLEAPFYSILIDNTKIEAAKGAFEGTMVATSFTPNESFETRFVSVYGKKPGIGSDTSFDAVMLLAQAIRATNSTDATIIKNYIHSLKSYPGQSGNLTFDGKGGVTKPWKFMVVKDGKLTPWLTN